MALDFWYFMSCKKSQLKQKGMKYFTSWVMPYLILPFFKTHKLDSDLEYREFHWTSQAFDISERHDPVKCDYKVMNYDYAWMHIIKNKTQDKYNSTEGHADNVDNVNSIICSLRRNHRLPI